LFSFILFSFLSPTTNTQHLDTLARTPPGTPRLTTFIDHRIRDDSSNDPLSFSLSLSSARTLSFSYHLFNKYIASLTTTHKETTDMPLFAPLRMPFKRRLQTLAVLTWISAIVVSLALFFFLCTYKYLWPLVIAYLTWVLMFDKAPERGGRRVQWLRNRRLWRHFAEYYPMTLIKVK
jgi:2-acylglycerol O-acyltransferase 2